MDANFSIDSYKNLKGKELFILSMNYGGKFIFIYYLLI